jgi:hypothetical protein
LIVVRRGRQRRRDGLAELIGETQRIVAELVRENRALKARNQRLVEELERVTAGWGEIKKLARKAPRIPRGLAGNSGPRRTRRPKPRSGAPEN